MIKKIKKFMAGILALTIMATATACGADTKWAMTYGDYEARAGIFLFYQMSAYNEAITNITEDNPDFDVSDTKALKATTVEDTPIVQWIQDNATRNVEIYLQVLKQFDELGLSLTDEELTAVDTLSDTYWQYYSEYYVQNGIGEQSFRDINTYTYKRDELFKYYYGEGGTDEVPEQELKDYYEENNARVKYICLNSTDADGNFMSDEMQKMASDYVQRANNGENFDDLIDEYNQYKEDLTAQQEAEAQTSDDDTISSIESTPVSASNDEDTLTIGDSQETSSNLDTTEEENPYPNEYIITKSEDESSGSPTYKVNQEIFSHTTFGDAFLVEEDNAYYVVVKYNIWEREDTWTDDTKTDVLRTLYDDAFEEKLLSSIDDTQLTINQKAYNRYNPFDMKF